MIREMINNKLKIKRLTPRFLSALLLLCILLLYSRPSDAQDFTTGDTFSTYAVSFGVTTFAFIGIASLSENANYTSEKSRTLNESELLEARDQLLEYQAKDESGLKDYQMAYLYPMLHKYIKQLRRVTANKKLSNDDLIQIAEKDLL